MRIKTSVIAIRHGLQSAKLAKKKKMDAEKADIAETAPTTTAIAKTVIDKVSNRPVINFASLEPQVKVKLSTLTNELQDAMHAFGVSGLQIGRILSEIEILLKPRGVWVAFLAQIPGLSQNTAYRYIRSFTVAQTKFPKHVLDVVMTTGIKMIGTEEEPYGKYTPIVKKLPPPTTGGQDAANQWINKVEAKYKESYASAGAKKSTYKDLQKNVFSTFIRMYNKVEDKSKLKFIKETFGYCLTGASLIQDFQITPMDLPEGFVKEKETETETTEKE